MGNPRAQKILPQKNQLTTSDAEALEGAFAAKLSALGGDAAADNDNIEISKKGESANGKLNHEDDVRLGAKRTNGSPTIRCETAEQPVTPIGKTLRLRDRDQPQICKHATGLRAQPVRCASSQVRARTRPWAQGERRIYRAPLPYSSS